MDLNRPVDHEVLAGLLFTSHLSALSANRFSIRAALGALEGSSSARALGTPVDAALCSVAAWDALLCPICLQEEPEEAYSASIYLI